MASSIPASKKSRGRPATGVGRPIQVRLQLDQLALLDAWIADQMDPKPTRPEAIRQVLSAHFKAKGYD
jgi:hypothetical protein